MPKVLCGNCKGRGVVIRPDRNGFEVEVSCGTCKGEGWVNR